VTKKKGRRRKEGEEKGIGKGREREGEEEKEGGRSKGKGWKTRRKRRKKGGGRKQEEGKEEGKHEHIKIFCYLGPNSVKTGPGVQFLEGFVLHKKSIEDNGARMGIRMSLAEVSLCDFVNLASSGP
jgi:hypothetical protein